MRRKLKQQEFYCVSCRGPVKAPSRDICFATTSSSKRKKIPMLKAWCSKCDGAVNKLVKNSRATALKKKYGKC
jgi:hypothetical protein